MSYWLSNALIGMLKCAATCVVIVIPFLFLGAPDIVPVFLLVAMVASPVMFVVMGIAGLWAWKTGGNPQLIGALAFLPLFYLTFAGADRYKDWRRQMAIDERYLSRVVERPSGQFDTVLMKGIFCDEPCAEILADGFAQRVTLHDFNGSTKRYRLNTYRLGLEGECGHHGIRHGPCWM